MNSNERDHRLELFLLHVDAGTTPPTWLMEYIADGVREYLKHGKPWQIDGGRPAYGRSGKDHLEAVSLATLEQVGVSHQRAASIMGLAGESAKTLARHRRLGKACIDVEHTGRVSQMLAIEKLLDRRLLVREREMLKEKLAALQLEHDAEQSDPEANV